MSQPINLFVPKLLAWLLRIPTNRSIAAVMREDALTFAGWYAVVQVALAWPKEVEDIQRAHRSRKVGPERMMKLLAQVNYTFAGKTTADHARRILEGYEVHGWVQTHFNSFLELVKDALTLYSAENMCLGEVTAFQTRMKELCQALKLTELESDILTFTVCATVSEELKALIEPLAADQWASRRIWTTIFEAQEDELRQAMRPDSALRLSGLLQPMAYRSSQMAAVSSLWVELLAASQPLEDALLEPMSTRAGSGMPATLAEADFSLACSILRNADEPGVNLMLYGASSLEKRRLVAELAKQAERQPWCVKLLEDASSDDRRSLTNVASALLGQKEDRSLLVVEQPGRLLRNQPSTFAKMLFGIELSREDSQAHEHHMLSANPVPTVWAGVDVAQVSDEVVAQFVFHAPLKKADKQERMAALQERLQGLKLSKKAVDDILKLDGVSSAQLEAALKAARLSGCPNKRERDQAVVQAVRRSQRALGRDVQAKVRTPVTQYSLKYLNTAGRFGPEQILAALKKNPRGAIVLYGPPGTGKTQFVEYLAQELGMPLVAKRASELLSKWVGESEKNIAAAFEEAASEDAILLLDEGDSFLRDRTLAHAGWEVTQVNELLQLIERFEGIVVVCTNLFTGLDAAALRRFTFKVEFRQLDADQRWEMFVNETGLKGRLSALPRGTKDEWFERLCLMRQLTPGDFATVKRQCNVLSTTLTPEEWLEQLQIECDVKTQPRNERNLL